jgi:hypothetical protein
MTDLQARHDGHADGCAQHRPGRLDDSPKTFAASGRFAPNGHHTR